MEQEMRSDPLHGGAGSSGHRRTGKTLLFGSWSYSILEAGIHSPYDVYYVFEQEEKILGYCNLRVLAGEGSAAYCRTSRKPPPGAWQKNDGCDGRVCYPGRCLCHQPGGMRRQPCGRNLYESSVLPQRQCEKPTIITRPRMLSSCGSGICRKELPLKIANISVYNVGDAASVPCPLFSENTEKNPAPPRIRQHSRWNM